MRRGRYSARIFWFGAAASLAFHLGWVVPKLFAPLFMKAEPEMEVAFVDPPSTESATEALDEVADVKMPSPSPEPAAKDPAPEPAETTPAPSPSPPPIAQLQPTPPPPPAPPPPPMPKSRMQMVDQEKFNDEADNPDAKYLAQKNHRAEKETSAKETNLLREVESEQKQTTEKSENTSSDVGGKDDKIAELEDRRGEDLPRSSLMQGQEGMRLAEDKAVRGPLSMRNAMPRAEREIRGEKREGVEQEERGAGDLAPMRRGQGGARATSMQKGGKRVRLTLDHHDYDRIEGFATAEDERHKAARAETSHHAGRYDKYLKNLALMRSSIENFTPEVKPGNQAELGTRASPFAAYITHMHRQIHKLWTFGFLSEQDGRSGRGPFDDMNLWTQLEIVLKGDGTVEKVTIVRTSGLLAFDVAAIDSVRSAAPFPKPPQVIRSANGKVYLDWQFHRDERACGTFGVDPHILTTPGDNQDHDKSEVPGRNAASGKSPLELPASPRTLRRNEPVSPSASAPAPTTPTPSEVAVPEVTAEARSAAEGWFAAYRRGDAAWLAGWSATPFTSAGETVAKDAGALKAMYGQLLAEAGAQRIVEAVEVFTPAGIRARLGGLPPGGVEQNMLFAVGKVGRDEFILLLRPSNKGWRVAGLDR